LNDFWKLTTDLRRLPVGSNPFIGGFLPPFLFLDVMIETIQYLQSIPGFSPMTTIVAGAPAGISGRIPPN
jgi:hypothetical protein